MLNDQIKRYNRIKFGMSKLVYISSCQVFLFKYPKGKKALSDRLQKLARKRSRSGRNDLLQVYYTNKDEILDGRVILKRYDVPDIDLNYCFNIQKNIMILTGSSIGRGSLAREFIKQILDVDKKSKTPYVDLTPHAALAIAKKLIKYDKNNKIIKPKFDFAGGYKHKDGTRYFKFEYTIGTKVCAMRKHKHFDLFYNHSTSFDFKAWVINYTGLVNKSSKGSSFNVRDKYSFSIYKKLDLVDWYKFVNTIFDKAIH